MSNYETFLVGFFIGGSFISVVQRVRRWAQEKARKRGWGFYAPNGNFVWNDKP